MDKAFPRVFIFLSFIISLSVCFGQNSTYFRLPAGVSEKNFIKNTIILKIKSDYATSCKKDQIGLPQLSDIFQQIDVVELQKKFPGIKAPNKKFNAYHQKFADLSLIYEIKYTSSTNIETVINKILSTGLVEYAQPHYIMKPLDYHPNDPLISNQYHLSKIKAYSAWDTVKGDTNIVVGICDWGTDISHPDLSGNIKYNYQDPVDGIDNDNDGYTDNFRGWDMGDNDNNPTGNISHGTFVAGLSSATTDNHLGISGTGFLCKFLPVKVCNSNDEGTMTYESIVYAAEHGCNIINCSWGDTFYSGPYGQDVIDYATINKGALVVAACGNDDNNVLYFPASYDRVLSVASSNASDHKADFSSFGIFVDITAPGDNVWSTQNGGTYGSSGGTSFSSSITAGCAALLKSRFPALTGLQIGEKLKVAADIIDTLPSNTPYLGLLGSGRLNIYNALYDTSHPSIEMYNIIIKNSHNQNAANPGDTLYISGDFINYLSPSTNNLQVAVACTSPNVSLIDSVFNIGMLPMLGTTNNSSVPFRVSIKQAIGRDEQLVFTLTFTDSNYRAVQYFYMFANKDYLDIDTNMIATSLTSDGVLGYANGNSLQGLGFRYNNGETMMHAGGFLVGRSVTQVSNAIYSNTGAYDHDFAVIVPLKKNTPPDFSDFSASGIFNDSNALAYKLNITAIQHVYAWKNPPNDKFIIIEYVITNNNAYNLSGVYAGLFADWDINNSMANSLDYDEISRTIYCFSPLGSDYAGIALLSPGTPFHYAFDNDGANGSIKISDGFTSNEKYIALKTNRNNAGISGSGNDVSGMLSTGPFTIASGDSVKVIFALLAGDNFNDIQNSALAANQAYYQTGITAAGNNISDNILFQNQPNPFKEKTSISIYLKSQATINLSFYDIEGNISQIIFKGNLSKGIHTFYVSNKFKPGIYVYALTGADFCLKKKMCVVK